MNDVLFEEFRTGVRIPPPPYLTAGKVSEMVSSIKNSFGSKNIKDARDRQKKKKSKKTIEEKEMSDKKNQQVESIPPYSDDDEFDFVDAYSDEPEAADEELLPENTATSAIDCAFIGVGGGGGKLAKAFLDLGFNRTLLVNTTIKDQPDGIEEGNFLLIPGADGVGKDVNLGRKILEENSAMVEDSVRARLGNPDWIFVLAGGGGGTGSACSVLHESLQRNLTASGASGKVVYVISKPSSQELLNSTIARNYESALEELKEHPHIVLDNERQLQLLRNKVGMLNLYPTANRNFAKLLAQVFKLAETHSDIQTFDTKDLEKCLSTPGRMMVGSTMIKDTSRRDLGAAVLTSCVSSSPCPAPSGHASTGTLLLIASSEMAGDPKVSKNLEAAFSYVGGRTDTLFSGVYIKDRVPGLVAICVLAGC